MAEHRRASRSPGGFRQAVALTWPRMQAASEPTRSPPPGPSRIASRANVSASDGDDGLLTNGTTRIEIRHEVRTLAALTRRSLVAGQPRPHFRE